MIWCKPWKREKENTTTNTVIYDTPTDTVQAVPNVPVSMNTAYGTATGSRGVVRTSDNVAYGHVSATSNTGARQPDTVVYEAVQ
uniref:Uncharacterized protein n=1 Tax=Amphimedon queenslandica TaxID=400682 RepID=A0A1X7ULF2_AMPQE